MPRDLTPNDPRKRFEHVIKTYWGKSYKGESLDGAVLDTFYVTMSLLGAHDVLHPERVISHEPGLPSLRFKTDEIGVERVQAALEGPTDDRDQPLDIRDLPPESEGARRIRWATAAKAMLARLGQPYEYDKQGVIRWDGEQWGLADLVHQIVKVPEHSPRDFLIPWIARELVKLAKAVCDTYSSPTVGSALVTRIARVTRPDYYDAVHALYDKAPAIAQWVKETRTDVGKVDLAQALEAISTYKFKESLVEQGTVVYTFKDGWTVQELRTESALTAEGNAMQNCIASYHDAVEDGGTRIYSIRDKAGNPHVSMELGIIESRIPESDVAVDRYDARYGLRLAPEGFVASPKRLSWIFKQILGKQNDMPIDPYRDRAREFIDKVFDKEGFGWCIAGGTAKWARFAGRKLDGLDVPEILSPNHVSDDILAGADFTGANLKESDFSSLELAGCVFNKANLAECSFTRADLTGAKFEGASCYFSVFASATLVDASFDSAHCGAANFEGAILGGSSFRGASVDGAHFSGARGAFDVDWDGVELTATQRRELEQADVGMKRYLRARSEG